MPPLPENLQLSPPVLAIPLPRFRQPISDPPLPEVTGDPAPTTETQPSPLPSSGRRPGPDSPEVSPPPPPVLNPDHPARTRISSAGDARTAYKVVAGLVAMACGWAALALGRRGLHFRQPTNEQIDGFAQPIGAILARHLPIDVIGPDLIDATAAAGAAHRYVLAGPIVARIAAAEDPEES
jgi:hypothetical protein